ncbi:transitional endoplasmic reticulum ATPase [Encephalitozoon romaleae SJ-2008]|uniref:Transitional endoplasmic reticulum ATPase n=1 Tax=Encephalitozoon romaleae (strain SJ-2008) TaxID=1178016 RepID=I6ZIK0_ENCRO|nr:transitional endoplasmic reticulum ATPase [Encephalitozoon romaleae SJ-2008]AFN83048.1 transitional endoplasmic reticulum ATPase [Encephalitozoon romaleae SJ-2008]
MNRKNPMRDAGSALRDKYITSHLNESLKIDHEYPPLQKVGGIKYLLPKITELVYNPLFSKASYDEIGIHPPSTLLLHGVSGVGKTFLVNCISQEYKLPIIRASLDSDKELRESFRKSSLLERSIILIEDIDVLGEDDKKVISQLSEYLENHKGKSIVIATARNPAFINESLNKFDNSLLVKIPTAAERREILISLTDKMKCQETDWTELAKLMPGFVARDLKRALKIASTKAVADGSSAIRMIDLEVALKEMKWKGAEITFDSIGSLEDVKDELNMSIIFPSRFPEKFRKLGITRPSGILLYGPPGCGKTLLVRAVSNMSHCNFLSIKGPELISKYVGDSEKEIRKLFDKAKQLQPCVLFFDEIDSLCGERNGNEFTSRIVNQILTLLDGLDDRGDVYVIGATNRIESIDKAILRPGRFDKILKVPLPSKEGCVDIFRKCTKGIPIEPFDFEVLNLEGFSGAEIAGLIRDAAILCLKHNFDSDSLVITKENIIEALEAARVTKDFR